MKKLLLLFSVCILILPAGCASAEPGKSPADIYNPVTAAHPPPAADNLLLVTRLRLIGEAATYMRTPYASPPGAPVTFDCSSFVSHVYSQFGYNLPKSTGAYSNVGARIDWKDTLPGDLLVFARQKGSSQIDHVAMLWKKSDSGELAGSWIIHAASINTGVSMQRGNPDTRTGIVITQLGLRGNGVIDDEYFYQRFMFCARVLDK